MMWFKYNLPMKKIWIHSEMSNLKNINIIFDSGANEFLLRWIKEHNPGYFQIELKEEEHVIIVNFIYCLSIYFVILLDFLI